MSYQVLYTILPDLLDGNPFSESLDLQVAGESARVLGSGGLQVPAEMQHLVEVLTNAWRLLSDCQLHPEISSQLVGYLFFFINASLFNSLMERGTSVSVPRVYLLAGTQTDRLFTVTTLLPSGSQETWQWLQNLFLSIVPNSED